MRRRLDAEMVRRCISESRERAQLSIAGGRVLVSGTVATKPARLVDASEPIELLGPRPRFVSRGGEKLDAALGQFGIDVTGLAVLDAGASTGGFTDCALQRGAASVVAVDVGFGQLHERLRSDPRVEVHEHLNLRTADSGRFGERRFPLVVADLSFISLTAVVPALMSLASAELVVLVKPQFEVGRAAVSKGRGVVSDPELWRSSIERVVRAFAERGAAMMGCVASPITGAEGNVEFLVHLRVAPSDRADVAIERGLISAAIASVATRTGGDAMRGPGASP